MMPCVSARPSESYRGATTAGRGLAASSPSLPLQGRRSRHPGSSHYLGSPRRFPWSSSRRSCCGRSADDEALYELPQGRERCRDQEGGSNNGEGGLLASEGDEDSLQHHDATEVECGQHGRQRAVYKGTVYDLVNVVEAVPQHGDAYGHRQTSKANHSEYEADLPQPRHASRL